MLVLQIHLSLTEENLKKSYFAINSQNFLNTFSRTNQWFALRRYRSPDPMPLARSAMRGWGQNVRRFPCFSPDFSHSYRAGSTLAELIESHHRPRPKSK